MFEGHPGKDRVFKPQMNGYTRNEVNSISIRGFEIFSIKIFA